jgi:hypothetical protein
MLGFVTNMGIKVDPEPHSQSTVGYAAPATQRLLWLPCRLPLHTH